MIQQVNFYTLLPKAPPYKLTLRSSIRLVISFAAILVCIHLVDSVAYYWQKQKLADLQQFQTIAEQQLAQLSKQYEDNTQTTKPLGWQNQQLMLELQDKQTHLEQLKSNDNIPEKGFANYLVGFAKSIAPGVWLKQIHVNLMDHQIDLTGSTNNSAAVMQFVKNLSTGPVLHQQAFNLIKLENSTENSAILNFTLSTKAPEQHDNTNKTTS